MMVYTQTLHSSVDLCGSSDYTFCQCQFHAEKSITYWSTVYMSKRKMGDEANHSSE